MRRGSILLTLILLSFSWPTPAPPQPVSKEAPLIKLGEITYRVREAGSSPAPLRMIELYVEILNRSRTATAPANSIRIVVSQKGIVYADQKPSEEHALPSQEMTLPSALPPLSGRSLIFGFSLPDEKIESITFEVSLNPPEGEKRSITCSPLSGQ